MHIRSLNVEMMPTASLKPDPKNARTHSKRQIKQVARSIKMFGWVNPVIVDQQLTILAGHARLEAAKMLGLDRVPIIRIDDMTKAHKRAYMLAANKIASNAGWDKELLALELSALLEIEDHEFDITVTGFEMGEIDMVIGEQPLEANDESDLLPHVDPELPLVSEPGDLWHLGEHRLLCGDATSDKAFSQLMDGATAEMVFTDPPYNVAIDGNVSGLGKAKHTEFAMASGEMTSPEFIEFLKQSLSNMATYSADGSVHFVCMDWRHGAELQAAADGIYSELKNICVWTKTNGGMGSLYRSAHEFVFVYKKGKARHINNIELGRHGRNRTNVWSHVGMNAFGAEREELLSAHPTVKPVALVQDAILDCSKPRRDRARSLCRFGHHLHRGRTGRASLLRARDQSRLLRPHPAPLQECNQY